MFFNKNVSFVILGFLFCIVLLCCSSPSESKIVGKWRNDHSPIEMIEFYKDGTCNYYQQMQYNTFARNGNYKIIGGNTLQLSFDKDGPKNLSVNIKFSDENSMTIFDSKRGETNTFTRVR